VSLLVINRSSPDSAFGLPVAWNFYIFVGVGLEGPDVRVRQAFRLISYE